MTPLPLLAFQHVPEVVAALLRAPPEPPAGVSAAAAGDAAARPRGGAPAAPAPWAAPRR